MLVGECLFSSRDKYALIVIPGATFIFVFHIQYAFLFHCCCCHCCFLCSPCPGCSTRWVRPYSFPYLPHHSHHIHSDYYNDLYVREESDVWAHSRDPSPPLPSPSFLYSPEPHRRRPRRPRSWINIWAPSRDPSPPPPPPTPPNTPEPQNGRTGQRPPPPPPSLDTSEPQSRRS